MNDIFSEHNAIFPDRGPVTAPSQRRPRAGGRVVTDTAEEEWGFEADTDRPGVVFEGSQAAILLAQLERELPPGGAAGADDDDQGWVGADPAAASDVPATLVADGDAGVFVSGSLFDNLRNDVAEARQKRFETQRGLAKPGQAKAMGDGGARVAPKAKAAPEGAGATEGAARRPWVAVVVAAVAVLGGGGVAALALTGAGAGGDAARAVDRGPMTSEVGPVPAEPVATPTAGAVEGATQPGDGPTVEAVGPPEAAVVAEAAPAVGAAPEDPALGVGAEAAPSDDEVVTLDELVVNDDEAEPAAPIPTVRLDELLAREATAGTPAAGGPTDLGHNAPPPVSHPEAAVGHRAPAAPKAAEPVQAAPAPAPEPVKAAAAAPAPEPVKAAAAPAPEPVQAAPAPAPEPEKAAAAPAPEPVKAAAAPAPESEKAAAAPAPEPVKTAGSAPKPEPAPPAATPAPEPVKTAGSAPKPEPAPPAAAPAKPTGRLSEAALDAYDEARTLHRTDPQRALALYADAASHGNVAAWRQIGTLRAQLGDKPAAIAALKKYRAAAPAARDSQMVADMISRLGGSPD